MCNAFVLLLAPTIICVCHSGTGTFSGDHCGYLSLDASAIPGPGHSLKHPHGKFYCFVCFTPSRGAGLAFLSFQSSLSLMERYCGSPTLPSPLSLWLIFLPLPTSWCRIFLIMSFHCRNIPPSVVGIMFIICSQHF